MTTENLFVDDGDNWQTVEAVSERLPQFDAVASFTCTQHAHTCHHQQQ